MLYALPQLLPDQVSPWMLLLIVLVALSLDILLFTSGFALIVLFVVFKAGKAVYDAIDKAIEWIIDTVLRFIEDALESPPLNRIAFLQLVLVGVKKAYDIINGAQKLLEVAINVAVTLLAIVLAVAYVIALAMLNLVALVLVIHYLV
jgi:hypothetical protein